VGHTEAQFVEALRYKPEGRGFDWNFSLIYSFRTHYDPEVNSAFNKNEHQVYFLGVKATDVLGCQPDHIYLPIVVKSGSLSLLTPPPPGPVQACKGIVLLSPVIKKSKFKSQIISSEL